MAVTLDTYATLAVSTVCSINIVNYNNININNLCKM